MTNANDSCPAHTPAPWTIEDESDSIDVFLELKGDFGIKPIAHLYTSFESDEYEYDTEEECLADFAEYEANAHLITAAPELLQCAKNLLMVCEDRISMLIEEETALDCGLLEEDGRCTRKDSDRRLEYYRLLKKDAKLAIAKATGR